MKRRINKYIIITKTCPAVAHANGATCATIREQWTTGAPQSEYQISH